MFPMHDLAGKRFGRLVAMKPNGKQRSYIAWLCQCDCGKEITISSSRLVNGVTKSCGCYWKEVAKNGRGYVKGTAACQLDQNIHKNNTTGIRGVSFQKSRNKYEAYIMFKRKHYHLGRYDNAEDAAKARKIAEEHIWGDFLEWYNNEYRKEYI
jgi:hypothetical protein